MVVCCRNTPTLTTCLWEVKRFCPELSEYMTQTSCPRERCTTASVRRPSLLFLVKDKVLPYSLLTKRLAQSWSQCSGSQRAVNFSPVVGCHYFPPGLQSPSKLKNVTVLWPVSSYTAWRQRHIGVNNLPKVITQLCPSGIWTQDLLITSPMPYYYNTMPLCYLLS